MSGLGDLLQGSCLRARRRLVTNIMRFMELRAICGLIITIIELKQCGSSAEQIKAILNELARFMIGPG